MPQLTDTPYSALRENQPAYEVMLLRDQHDNSYTDIARELHILTSRATQLYRAAKRNQLRLYARHLAIAHGHRDTSAFRHMEIYDWYRDYKYVSAYWESEYTEILRDYRAGEPGHSAAFLSALLPPICEVSGELARRVVALREDGKKTFIEIGREMAVTREKVRDIYEKYYHMKWLAARDRIVDGYYSGGGARYNLRDYYREHATAKQRLEALTRDYPELFI